MTAFRSREAKQAALSVYPLASRIDAGNSALRRLWRYGGVDDGENIVGYQSAFERLLQEMYVLDGCRLEYYFDSTQVPHDVSFSYGEKIAVMTGITEKLSIGSAYANLTKWILSEAAPWEELESQRKEPVQFTRTWMRSVRQFVEPIASILTVLLENASELITRYLIRSLSPRDLSLYLGLLVGLLLANLGFRSNTASSRLWFPILTAFSSHLYGSVAELQGLSGAPREALSTTLVTLRQQREPAELLENVCARRAFLSQLIARLDRARPLVISLDGTFPPNSCAEGDTGTEWLRKAISSSSTPIVIGQPTTTDSISSSSIEVNAGAGDTNAESRTLMIAPSLRFEGSASKVTFGIVRLYSDVRRLPLTWLVSQDGRVGSTVSTPGFAFATAQAARELFRSDQRTQRLASTQTFPYTKLLPPSAFRSFSALEVLCGGANSKSIPDWRSCSPREFNERAFSGRVVIIGVENASDMRDSIVGPISSVALQANYVEAILNGNYLIPVSFWIDAVVICISIVVINWMFRLSFSPVRALVWSVSLLMLLWLASYVSANLLEYIFAAPIFVTIFLMWRFFIAGIDFYKHRDSKMRIA